MNTIDKIVATSYGPAHAFPPEYTGVPLRSPATSIVLAEAVKRSKEKSPGLLATVKAWLREMIMVVQPEAVPRPAACR